MSSASFVATATPSSAPLGNANSIVPQYTTPLLKMLPYVQTAFAFAWSTSKSALEAFGHVAFPVSVIMYIIAPLTVFLSYVASLFFFTPASTALYLLDALHPLYVFCGVACLTGLVLGVVGRLVAGFLVAALLPEEALVQVVVKEEEDEEDDEEE